jgi:alpha-N-arabinofuranosidase
MIKKARLCIDTNRRMGKISPLLFGGFAEHMGRCVYEGIYDPKSKHADEEGFRKDVIDACREINYRILRYPGGNFLSGYHWQDGVGEKHLRPRKRELAWQSIETNQFGTDEFMSFCKKLNCKPMLGVNLGTGTIEEAGHWVEYCNGEGGTQFADLRIAHGHVSPHNVSHWCLGNEMDGHWQIGHLDAHSYATKAREAAKIMRWHDPSIQLIACGSSSNAMPTYPEWDRIVLETCWEHIDCLSLHYYAGNRENDTQSYLASALIFENHLDTLSGLMRFVKAKLRSKRDVFLSWDEWNVWYKNQEMNGHWSESPHLIEEIYNLEDALVVAQWLNVFLRKCDTLKIACFAQIVNVIAPLLTVGDKLLKQSTFYPLQLASRFAKGDSLDVNVDAPVVSTRFLGDAPMLDVAASYDDENNCGAIFIVNRHISENVLATINWQNRKPKTTSNLFRISGTDPKAVNSTVAPNRVSTKTLAAPELKENTLTLRLPPMSYSVFEWHAETIS